MESNDQARAQTFYKIVERQTSLIREITRFSLPDIDGEFVSIPPPDFECETAIDLESNRLLIPRKQSGVDDGPYVVVVLRSSEDVFDVNARLLHWLRMRPQRAFVVFGRENPAGEWLYESHRPAEEVFEEMGPMKMPGWGFQ
jgi:hypothetical protein